MIVSLGNGPASMRYMLPPWVDGPYIGGLDIAALRGRGESGWSEKGEKADMRGLAEGLKPNGPLTAIMMASACVGDLHPCPMPWYRTGPKSTGDVVCRRRVAR